MMTTSKHVAGTVVGLTALLALFLIAFTWPTSEAGPRHVPVAVAGPETAIAGLAQGTSALGEDAIDLTAVGSRAEALTAIEDREVYGAFVLERSGAELLVAPAASPAVADLLEEVARNAPAGSGPRFTVTDVAPLPEGDPRGTVFRAGALPLVIGGILLGVVLAVRMPDPRVAAAGAVLTAASAGLALVGLLQGWLDALDGSYLANAGVVALGLGAVGLTMIGLKNVLGFAGVGLTALTMMLLGNPLSGVTSAPELLPSGWGALGQLLPPGATGSALRSTAFFDGAGAGVPLLVLTCWALGGLALALVPRRTTASSSSVSPADRGNRHLTAGNVPAL